jgi:hypothetical protein
MASTPALPAAPAFEPGREIVLVCTAIGAAQARPPLTPAQICAAFKRRLDAGLGRATRAEAALPRTGNSIRVELRVASSRGASALVTTAARGKSTRWPEIAVDAMDRPLGLREIEQLAGEVAKTITHTS